MRILCLTSSYPRHGADIAGRFVLEFCEHLARRGHTLDVLTWSDRGTPPAQAPAAAPVRVHRVRYAPAPLETLFYGAGTPENLEANPLKAALAAPAMAAMLARAVYIGRAQRVDLVVGHWLVPGGLLARICGRLLGVPSLVVGHSGGVHLLGALPRPVGRALAHVVAHGPLTLPSDALRDKLARLTDASHVAVLPMGFEPVAAEGHGGERRDDWLCIGRLVPIKGVDLAIDAFLTAALPAHVRLHIAGDGPERARLEARAAGSPRVVFHGVVRGEARRALFARCGFVLATSRRTATGRHEGLPVSLLEALSAGLVPLVGDVPGAERFLVEPALQHLATAPPPRWARAIETLAARDAATLDAMRREGRTRAAPLAWPELAPQWEATLANALTGR